jgi:hypothetical protein
MDSAVGLILDVPDVPLAFNKRPIHFTLFTSRMRLKNPFEYIIEDAVTLC